ncbi:MAG TPA: hypothetical protein DDW65_07065 [Firmicutes bacterium]|nr:hypothetical protein [Bacillota bacterium]
MKRILLSVIAVIFLFSVMGCGGSSGGNSSDRLSDAEINAKVAAMLGAQNASTKVDQHSVTSASSNSLSYSNSNVKMSSDSPFDGILGTLHWIGPNDGWYTATLSYSEGDTTDNYTMNWPLQFKQLASNQYEIKAVNATEVSAGNDISYPNSYPYSYTDSFELLDFIGTVNAQNRWTGTYSFKASSHYVKKKNNEDYTIQGTGSSSFSNSSLADETGSFVRDASYHDSRDSQDHVNHWEYTVTLTGNTYTINVTHITNDGISQSDWSDTWTK